MYVNQIINGLVQPKHNQLTIQKGHTELEILEIFVFKIELNHVHKVSSRLPVVLYK